MVLARGVGFSVPEVRHMLVGDVPCILVERYDRRTDESGNTIRIHQEDFCQALGLPPERKYQSEGGPTVSDCVSLLREWSTTPVLDIPAFINGLIFNMLVGNADAHGKNFSLLYHEGARRLAPLYDMVSTLYWPELSKTAAMKVGGCDSINAFIIGDWRKTADKCGLSWPLVHQRITKIARIVLDRLPEVREQISPHDEQTSRQLHDVIASRAERML